MLKQWWDVGRKREFSKHVTSHFNATSGNVTPCSTHHWRHSNTQPMTSFRLGQSSPLCQHHELRGWLHLWKVWVWRHWEWLKRKVMTSRYGSNSTVLYLSRVNVSPLKRLNKTWYARCLYSPHYLSATLTTSNVGSAALTWRHDQYLSSVSGHLVRHSKTGRELR